MNTIKKGYLFFDTVYTSKDNKELQVNFKDYSHKQTIDEVFIILDKSELDYFNQQGFISSNGIQVFFNEEHAKEELEEII